MNKYHISSDGEPALCTAKKSCRLGGPHFENEDDARIFYEQSQESVIISQKKDPYLVTERNVKETLNNASAKNGREIRTYLRMLDHADYDMVKAYRGKVADEAVVNVAIDLHRAKERLSTLQVNLAKTQRNLRSAKTETQRKAYLKTVANTQKKVDAVKAEVAEVQARVNEARSYYDEKLQRHLKSVTAVKNYQIRDEVVRVNFDDRIQDLRADLNTVERGGVKSKVDKATQLLNAGDSDSIVAAAEAYGSKTYIETSENYRTRILEVADQNAKIETLEIERSEAEDARAEELKTEIDAAIARRDAAQLSLDASTRKIGLFRSEVRDLKSYIDRLEQEIRDSEALNEND